MSRFPVISSINEASGPVAHFTDDKRHESFSLNEPVRPGHTFEFTATGPDGEHAGIALTVRIGGRQIATQEPGPIRFEVTSDDIGAEIVLVVKARGSGKWHAFDTGAVDEHDASVGFQLTVRPPAG